MHQHTFHDADFFEIRLNPNESFLIENIMLSADWNNVARNSSGIIGKRFVKLLYKNTQCDSRYEP